MKTTYKVILISIVFIFCSCARIVTPSGGDKDITAPKYVSSKPKINAVNFKGNKIEIDFDEYIVLDNASAKLIVSPPLKQKPTVSSKLNTLYIKNIDSLEENTTYIFDFADAITDYTEGNRLSHFSFAFSTGNEIDSLSYQGRVLNAYTLQPEPNKYVALYKNTDKKYIREHLSDYITRADSFGRFYFQNIKAGKYFVLAFEDLNQNMLYDLPTESYGVMMCSVDNVMKEKDTLTNKKAEQSIRQLPILYYNTVEDTMQKILSSQLLNNRELQIITSLPVSKEFAVEFSQPLIDKEDYRTCYNKSRDTIIIMAMQEKVFDTIKAIIKDKNDFNEKLDLFYNVKRKNKKKENPKFNITLGRKEIPFFENLTLTIPNVINEKKYLPLQAMIVDSADTLRVEFVAKEDNPKILYCTNKLNQGKNYLLLIDSAQIYDCNGKYNDTLSAFFHIDTEDDYGSFIVSVFDSISDNKNVILSLFDEKNNQVGEDIFAKTDFLLHTFRYLAEGKYKLRLIEDANNNKKWDRGDFDKNILPEKVIYFEKIINIRKGWQTQEDWILE